LQYAGLDADISAWACSRVPSVIFRGYALIPSFSGPRDDGFRSKQLAICIFPRGLLVCRFRHLDRWVVLVVDPLLPVLSVWNGLLPRAFLFKILWTGKMIKVAINQVSH
jgi:hypothetical protein